MRRIYEKWRQFYIKSITSMFMKNKPMIHIKKKLHIHIISVFLFHAHKRDTFLTVFIIERHAKFECLLENIAKNTV